MDFSIYRGAIPIFGRCINDKNANLQKKVYLHRQTLLYTISRALDSSAT